MYSILGQEFFDTTNIKTEEGIRVAVGRSRDDSNLLSGRDVEHPERYVA